LRYILGIEAFLPIALLPRSARDALVQLYRSDMDPDDPGLQTLLARLGELNDASKDAIRPVRLTDRELILLPLLAGDDAVPEIARKLQVSVNTVRKQVVTLREKFHAESRADLIKKAIAYGAIR
jgi:DNA-binding NarL/FixJ family response regulator